MLRWVKEVEVIVYRGGMYQPREVEKSLMKRLRNLGLPPRLLTMLDEAEGLIADNQLRLLNEGKAENADYGFVLLAHEVRTDTPTFALSTSAPLIKTPS